ncbi:hypothetical protein B0H63DRAFT_456699 [Podospora didyma]|uniref:Uncharacterized protein n=1 Tax=Podospora didyma TaxID=330526 RepID=A0AAE0U6M5_9PEZI|nr:hypothetical protein B0H63DRAFT_456699 [Podospora didyma]
MRFSLVLLLAPAAMALLTEPAEHPQFGVLKERGCDYNGCKCDTSRPRKPQGQFCGGCKWSDGAYVITKKRVISHVYECNKDGGCCDYGYAKDCDGDKPGGRCG